MNALPLYFAILCHEANAKFGDDVDHIMFVSATRIGRFGDQFSIGLGPGDYLFFYLIS